MTCSNDLPASQRSGISEADLSILPLPLPLIVTAIVPVSSLVQRTSQTRMHSDASSTTSLSSSSTTLLNTTSFCDPKIPGIKNSGIITSKPLQLLCACRNRF